MNESDDSDIKLAVLRDDVVHQHCGFNEQVLGGNLLPVAHTICRVANVLGSNEANQGSVFRCIAESADHPLEVDLVGHANHGRKEELIGEDDGRGKEHPTEHRSILA